MKKVLIILLLLLLLVNVYKKRNIECNYNEYKIATGKDFLNNKKVAFCGLIRDGEERIEGSIKEIEKIGSYFKDWKLLIVENDSKDNTRKILLDYNKKNNRVKVLGCNGINLNECKLNTLATTSHNTTHYRINKMSMLRNIYLDELRKDIYNDIDYVIVWDFDLVGNVNIEGFLSSFYELKTNDTINAVCANGIRNIDLLPFLTAETVKKEVGVPLYVYYDTYAYRNFEDKSNVINNKWYYDILYSIPSGYSTDNLKKVKSCFGGFTIYRRDAILKSSYITYSDENGLPVCEHQGLNERINGVYHNNELLYLIYKN